MIKFTLACENRHEFESWFQNGAAFDIQVEAGLVTCPTCGVAKVAKAIMAPAIAGTRRHEPQLPVPPQRSEAPTKVALLDEKDRELRAMVESFRARIFAEADDVGEHFPDEARKMHDGLVEERPIHGQASFEEARALLEEGIGILPVPALPDEHN